MNSYRLCVVRAGSCLKSSNVRWVSPVGIDAAVGGGVARAVDLFKQSNILPSADFLSLLGTTKWSQFRKALVDVYVLRYRRYVVHSFFTPYTLLLLLLPFMGSVVILPHGELKAGALGISSRYKKAFMWLLGTFRFLCLGKRLYLIASNFEEIERARDILPLAEVMLAPDLVHPELPIPIVGELVGNAPVNLVTISRLVPNKGVSVLLRELVLTAERGELGWLAEVFLFVTEEDVQETALVHGYSEKLRSLGKPVNIFVGMDKNQIAELTSNLPNKLTFLSSKFESFSYALLETLYFEYTPIVWFDNELVKGLTKEGLCVKLEPGEVVTDTRLDLLRRQDIDRAQQFIGQLSDRSRSMYAEFLEKVIYRDV